MAEAKHRLIMKRRKPFTTASLSGHKTRGCGGRQHHGPKNHLRLKPLLQRFTTQKLTTLPLDHAFTSGTSAHGRSAVLIDGYYSFKTADETHYSVSIDIFAYINYHIITFVISLSRLLG